MNARRPLYYRTPSLAAMEAMARRSLAALPDHFREHLGAVVLHVVDYADDDMLAEVGIEHPMQLSGLYTGRSLAEKSVWESGSLPDTIHLFRQPILDEADQRGITVERLVHHVLIHEIGHHFGLSDEDMHALEDQA